MTLGGFQILKGGVTVRISLLQCRWTNVEYSLTVPIVSADEFLLNENVILGAVFEQIALCLLGLVGV